MTIDFELNNINGYEVVAADPRRSGFHASYRYNDQGWDYQITLTPQQGLTQVRELAAAASFDLIQPFGWRGVTLELMADIQREALGTDQGSTG